MAETVENNVRRLVVMRHAKAQSFAGSDHARRLTDRGVRDAVAAGKWLAEAGHVPDYVLVSSSARTRATYECVTVGIGTSPEMRVADELYGADLDEVLALCSSVPDNVTTAMVVGHNPTMATVVHALQRDPADEWPAHLPTAGLAVLALTTDWAGLAPDSARLDDWYVPRG